MSLKMYYSDLCHISFCVLADFVYATIIDYSCPPVRPAARPVARPSVYSPARLSFRPFICPSIFKCRKIQICQNEHARAFIAAECCMSSYSASMVNDNIKILMTPSYQFRKECKTLLYATKWTHTSFECRFNSNITK